MRFAAGGLFGIMHSATAYQSSARDQHRDFG